MKAMEPSSTTSVIADAMLVALSHIKLKGRQLFGFFDIAHCSDTVQVGLKEKGGHYQDHKTSFYIHPKLVHRSNARRTSFTLAK